AIKDLKTVRARAEANKPQDGPVIKRGPGRPRKTEMNGVATTGRKPGRRKKRTVKEGGYRLSDWDQMVIDTINKTEKLLPKEEIIKHATTWARKEYPEMSQEDVEAKITRVLQKLSGKR